MNQSHTNATFFHPFTDALALVMDCFASSDLLALPGPMFHAQFEIINPSLASAVRYRSKVGFSHPSGFDRRSSQRAVTKSTRSALD